MEGCKLAMFSWRKLHLIFERAIGSYGKRHLDKRSPLRRSTLPVFSKGEGLELLVFLQGRPREGPDLAVLLYREGKS